MLVTMVKAMVVFFLIICTAMEVKAVYSRVLIMELVTTTVGIMKMQESAVMVKIVKRFITFKYDIYRQDNTFIMY